MKNFVLVLILSAGLFACKKDAVNEPAANTTIQKDYQRTVKQIEECSPDMARPGNGKGKGDNNNALLSVLNLTATVYGQDSIVLDWDTPPMNPGDAIMWTFVNRRLTFPGGQVYLMTDGYGIPIQGSDWQSILPGGYMYQPTRYVITNTAGLTTSGIVPGTYEFYVSGGTGIPYDSQNWAIYITNHVTVTVP
jgi:hypothetical protein